MRDQKAKRRRTPDMRAIARAAVADAGFEPDFPDEVGRELEGLGRPTELAATDAGVRDLRATLWSSIDNRESRDLDQVEYVERDGASGFRVLIGIADVDAFVGKGSAIDRHAAVNTVSVYTPAHVFPMLPEKLSTDLTSLVEGEDRLAVVIELCVDGGRRRPLREVYRALVRNRAKLDYDSAGAWLEGRGPAPVAFKNVEGLEAQVRLQDEVARALHELRRRCGALELEREELVPVARRAGARRSARRAAAQPRAGHHREPDDRGQHLDGRAACSRRACRRSAASCARPSAGRASSRRPPPSATNCPPEPDPRALSDFMSRRREADPGGYAELSLVDPEADGAGRLLVEAPGARTGGALRPRRQRLHALDRAQPALPRPRHAALPQGGGRRKRPRPTRARSSKR